jgi:hypothetical protein
VNATDNSSACIPTGLFPTPAITINATVPGDLVTDLQRAGKIGDPLKDSNFKNTTWFNGRRWIYSKTFAWPAAGSKGDGNEVLLVFEGIKMGATLSLNGHLLGNITDQFLRYTYPVSALLKASNTLEVVFDRSIDTHGRFMACSGGWDWAPYSDLRSGEGHQMFTRGIWKSVYLSEVPSGSVAIMHAVPTTRFHGAWPVGPLPDDGSSVFTVNMTVHIWSEVATTGTLTVTGEWGASAAVACVLPAGMGACVLPALNASGVDLWWPIRLGLQRMYNVTATFTPRSTSTSTSTSASASTSTSTSASASASTSATTSTSTVTRRIGFRLAALVTINDTSPAEVAAATHAEGTGNHTLMMRVNGAAVAARGANMIPMELMEGRIVQGMHRNLVASAAAANFNTIRVWGGGIYPLDEFFDACDDFGILGIIDMQYSTDGIFPGAKDTPTQQAEIRHQVRRMSHHPSIAVWSGCNECGSIGNLADVVAQEDQSRAIRAASPSLGYSAGVSRLGDFPTGNGPLVQRHSGPPSIHGLPWSVGESHGPYSKAALWPSVNGGGKGGPVNPSINASANPLALMQPGFTTGQTVPGYFVSETGATTMSSFESMSATLSEEHWGLHSPPFHERNYPCEAWIYSYFRIIDLNQTGAEAFQRQLYYCMFGQALRLKAQVEGSRSKNIFGLLLWQYNEVWPTGGWG